VYPDLLKPCGEAERKPPTWTPTQTTWTAEGIG